MIDIKEGDVLVVGPNEYPVKSCADWNEPRANSGSFRRLSRIAASTKRAVIAGGKRGAPSVHLTGLKCTPLDPVSPEIRSRLALDTPHELLETFLADCDGYVHLIVEDLKR